MSENNLKQIFQGLRTLVFPEICIMCRSEFINICPNCYIVWNEEPTEFSVAGMRVKSVAHYDDLVSSVVLKAKEDRNRVAQTLLAGAMAKATLAWCSQLDLKQVLIVPIPSTKAAIRRRGGSFLHPILDKVIVECRNKGYENIAWKEMLRHIKKVKDQSKLSYSDRKLNLSSAFTCIINENQLQEFNEKSIILIDDVVTSGATLLGAENALRERKMTVLGAVTACATARQLLIR